MENQFSDSFAYFSLLTSWFDNDLGIEAANRIYWDC